MPEADSGATRRRVLAAAATIGGTTAASLLLPPNVRRALADPTPARGSFAEIEHVVILMQENRSFDHYFGTLRGVRGFDDRDGLFRQPDPLNPDGYLLPFHLDTHRTNAQAIPSTSHAWDVQHNAWNHGAMDNWVPAHRAADKANGPYTMGYYTRADIPFQYALADAFTVCDNYFCSVLGPTHPNRHMLLTGTIDPDGVAGGPALDNNGRDYRWKTYAEMLSEAGVSWRYYQDTDEYNLLQYYRSFATAAPGSELYDRGMTVAGGRFEYDAVNDNLPTVSWIATTATQSEHPDYMPAAGANFVAGKIDAIAANPEVWAKTVFILNYDENDGLFDHVPPPVAPAGTPGEYVTATSPGGTRGNGLPVGPGFRVPCVIVSPWTAGGYVYREPADHTSVIRLLEKVTGVANPNISAYRRSALSDLTKAFRFGSRAKPPTLADTTGQLGLATYEAANLPPAAFPGSDQTMPHQEPGHRQHI
jgi:phospholipase C